MLGNSTIFATIAVSDIAAGKQFYGEKLGLEQVDENLGGVMYRSGEWKLFVYASTTGGTNQATCAGWNAQDTKATVEDLKAKGISFEHYDGMPGEWDGDVLVMGNMESAWFKDPDGNILSIGSMR